MSRRLFQHYLFFFFLNAILIYGSSRRISRSSCPSCSQDCPEALTVQVPWYSYRELNPQPRMQDFSVNPLRNSLHSRLTTQEVFSDMTRDISSNQNSMSFEDSFPQRESKYENLFFRNLPNKFSKSLDRREIFPRNEPMNKYPFVHIFPQRQSSDISKNLFFRNPRDKYSESSENRNFQDYRRNKEESPNQLFTTYRADEDTKSWDNSRNHNYPNNILPQRLFPEIENPFASHRENVFEERNLVKTIPNSVNQQDKFTNSQKAYPEEYDIPEKHDLRIFPQNVNIQKMTEDKKIFNNLNENSLRAWNLQQINAEENFLEGYPTGDEQMIITENDNDEQTNHNYLESIFPQDLNIWKPTDGKPSDNWNFTSKNSNSQEFAEIKQLQKAENNWRQLHSLRNDIVLFAEDQNEDYSDEEDINQKYFKDEIDKDVKIGRNSYNPYSFSQNINIWRAMQDEEPSDNLDFVFENLHDIQKGKQSEIYSQDNKYFQDKEENEDILFKSETHPDIDQMNRASTNSYETLFTQFLNIFNNVKHSRHPSESQESTNYNILHKNPIEERNARFFNDKTFIYDAQDLPKNIFNTEEYSKYNIPAINTWQDTKDNIQNKASREFDPDLFDDIEDLPTEPTESTLIESHVENSTPH